MTIISVDGASVASGTYQPGQKIFVKSTGGGFNINDRLTRNATNDGWLQEGLNAHYHDASSVSAGSTYAEIRQHNSALACIVDLTHDAAANWSKDTAGVGGTIADDFTTGAVKFDTLTTTSNWVQARIMGISASYAAYSFFQSSMRYTGNTTNTLVRIGVDFEDFLQANSNTQRKYGLEGCSGNATPNWYIITCDGTARSGSDSTIALTQASAKSFLLENNVGANVKLYFDTAHVTATSTKTSNLPSTGPTTQHHFLSAGVKTSDANSKQLYVWGFAFYGTISDTSWK